MSNSMRIVTEDHLPLHPLEFRVLMVLMDGELHGYGIAKEVERRDMSLGKIFPTNLYRRLRDMSDRGLIDQLTASSNGEQRRQFRVTKLGRRVAQAEARRLESLLAEARQLGLLPSHQGDR